MKHIQYKTQGTCSQFISVIADDNDVIQEVAFFGGCNGNLQGICRLVKGQKIDDVISRLNGIHCGDKPTSCPDQLCRALEQLKRQ
ncbi:MAG: TIGR03905 family TSCPD domain-containing protein [Bacteroidales bacterium]|nr:TIGR03905 family TSCPD domain-containing protein [Bacteroidales bacterium]